MQFLAESAVPEAISGDPSDVAVALEVAGALWGKGDREEALRWLRRAIDAASEAGEGPRAAALAHAAGMIEATLGARGEAVTRPEMSPPYSTPPPPPSPDATAPFPSLIASGAVLPASVFPPASAVPPASVFPPASAVSPASAVQPASAVPPPSAVPPASAVQPTSAVPAAGIVSPTPVIPPQREDRIRVSVKTSVRDPQLLLLRLLPAGQRPPTGTREGFLVLAAPEAERSHTNGGSR